VMVPDSHDPDAARFDLLGALLSTIALGSLIWSVIEAPSHGWTSLPILCGFALGLGASALFVVWENHTSTPMFEMSLLKSPQLSAAALTLTIAFIAMSGAMFLATISLQLVKGYTPLQAAIATSGPIVIVNLIVVPRAPWIMQRFGLRKTIAFGTAMTGVASLMITTTSTTSSYWMLGLGFAFMAVAFSVFMPASTEAMMTAVPPERSGGASALNQITRQSGQALGIALLGGIATVGFQSRFSDSAPAIADVSADSISDAGASLSAAVHLADSLPEAIRGPLMDIAGSSYIFGMRLALVVAAMLAFAGAAYAAKAIPSRITHHEQTPHTRSEVEDNAT